jgi:hypothetical protein
MLVAEGHGSDQHLALAGRNVAAGVLALVDRRPRHVHHEDNVVVFPSPASDVVHLTVALLGDVDVMVQVGSPPWLKCVEAALTCLGTRQPLQAPSQ